MKSNRTRLFPLALALALTSLSSCRTDPEPATITVDRRIELMGVVQYLSGYQLSTRYDFGYKEQVLEHFGPYRDHQVVELFRTMSNQGFAFDAVPKTMLTLTDPPDLDRRLPTPPDVVIRAGGEEALEEFVRQLRDFAAESDFAGFYEIHGPFYDSIVAATAPSMEEATRVLNEYLGVEVTDATLILGLLLHHGGFSTLFETGRRQEAYAILGPSSADSSGPAFGNAIRIGRISWHEFAHTVINDLTAAHREWVDEHSDLHGAIASDMDRLGYQSWETAINEHVVRAIVVRLVTRRLGPDVGMTVFGSEMDRGFRYLPQIWNELNRYEENRDQYPSIADFYPELLEVIATGIQVVEPEGT